MIVDLLLAPLLALAEWLVVTLPDGTAPTLPDLSPFWDAVSGLNSLMPVAEVLAVALTMFGALVVFLLVRLVLLVWNLVWP